MNNNILDGNGNLKLLFSRLYYTVAHKCKTNVSFQNNICLFETLCSFFKTNYILFKINVSFQNKCFISKQMFHFKTNVSLRNKCLVFKTICFVPLS